MSAKKHASQLTVQDTLGIGPLAEATVLAGAKGLGRVVRSVTVMDTPDIELWLHGGELLLTNAHVVKDDQVRLIQMLRQVDAKGAAAVGLKVREFLEDSVPKMVETCDELGLPLLSIPPQHPWADIITPLLGSIVDRQVAILRYALDVHESLSETVLQGGGLGRVAEQLARFVDSPVSILDASFHHLMTMGGHPLQDDVLAWTRDAVKRQGAAGRRAIEFEVAGGQRGAVATIAAGPEVYGYLVAADLKRQLGAFDLVALEQGALAASLEVLRERTEKALERRLRDTFLFDLLSGRIDDPHLALAWAKERGWDLSGPRAVCVVSLDSPSLASENLGLVGSVRRLVLGGLPSPPEVAWLELTDGVVLCVPFAGQDAPRERRAVLPRLRSLGEKLKKAASESSYGLRVTVGVGRVYSGPLSLAKSYREASQAVALARDLWGGDRVAVYDELSLYRVLSQYPLESEEIQAYCQESLGALLEHDHKHGTELTKTLEVYLDSLGSWIQAAGALRVHPNTLGYRMNRIGKLLGVDLKSPEERLNLELALRIRRMLDGRSRTLPQA